MLAVQRVAYHHDPSNCLLLSRALLCLLVFRLQRAGLAYFLPRALWFVHQLPPNLKPQIPEPISFNSQHGEPVPSDVQLQVCCVFEGVRESVFKVLLPMLAADAFCAAGVSAILAGFRH